MVKTAKISYIRYLQWVLDISPRKHVPCHFLFLSSSFLFRVMTAISHHEKETPDSLQSMFAGPKLCQGENTAFQTTNDNVVHVSGASSFTALLVYKSVSHCANVLQPLVGQPINRLLFHIIKNTIKS